MPGAESPESIHRSQGRTRLLLKDLVPAPAYSLCLFSVHQQLDQNMRQLVFVSDAERIMRAQIFRDGAKVGVVRPHHDRHAELRRFQRIVSARVRNAAADKRHRGEGIYRSQLSDRVEQNDLAGAQSRNRIR